MESVGTVHFEPVRLGSLWRPPTARHHLESGLLQMSALKGERKSYVFGQRWCCHPYVLNKPIRAIPELSSDRNLRGSQKIASKKRHNPLPDSPRSIFLHWQQTPTPSLGQSAHTQNQSSKPHKKTHRCSSGTGSSEEATKPICGSATWIKVTDLGQIEIWGG